MTHDELLATINNESAWFPDFINALRAVVELHISNSDYDNACCVYCTSNGNGEWVDYPCPTIQAIEKELQ